MFAFCLLYSRILKIYGIVNGHIYCFSSVKASRSDFLRINVHVMHKLVFAGLCNSVRSMCINFGLWVAGIIAWSFEVTKRLKNGA